jgi:arsenate reductase
LALFDCAGLGRGARDVCVPLRAGAGLLHKTERRDCRMKKKRVLFVCIHNSARSQMAEAFLNQICGNEFEAHSAGLEPGKLNPVVVEVMQESGLDIAANKTKSVSGFLGQHWDYVITVCDETSAERCPVFPGKAKRLHWGFPDPSSFQGAWEKLARTREVREAIKTKIESWCAEVCCAAG